MYFKTNYELGTSFPRLEFGAVKKRAWGGKACPPKIEMNILLYELQTLIDKLKVLANHASTPDMQKTIEEIKLLLDMLGTDVTNYQQDVADLKEQLDIMVASMFSCLEGQPELTNDFTLIVGKAYCDMGEFEAALEWYKKLLDNEDELPDVVHAQVLKQLGHIASYQNRWTDAESYYEKSRALFEEEGCMNNVADIYNNLGYNASQRGNFDEAVALHQQALVITEQVNAPYIRAGSHSSLAVIASIKSDWDVAIEHFEASLEAYEEADEPCGMASTYQNLAMAYVDCEEWEAAGECYQAATELAEEHGDTTLLATIYVNRAEFLLNLANIVPAHTYCTKALSLFRQMGDDNGIAEAYKFLGRIARRKKEWDEALGHFQASLELYQTCDNPQGLAEAYHELGLMYIEQNNILHAQESLAQSQTLFAQLGAEDELARVEEARTQCA